MNIKLSDVVQTNKDGDQFHKISEMYIKGSAIKYFSLQEDLLEQAKEN